MSSNMPYALSTTLLEDLRSPASSLSQGASPADACAVGPSGSVRALCFGNDEDVHGQVQLPHSARLGAGIALRPHVHWTSPVTVACNVKWNMEYMFANVDGVLPAPATLSATASTGTVAWTHHFTSLGDISPAFVGLSSMIMFRLYRTAADSDDCGDGVGVEPRLLEFDLHFPVNSLGSRQELVK